MGANRISMDDWTEFRPRTDEAWHTVVKPLVPRGWSYIVWRLALAWSILRGLPVRLQLAVCEDPTADKPWVELYACTPLALGPMTAERLAERGRRPQIRRVK